MTEDDQPTADTSPPKSGDKKPRKPRPKGFNAHKTRYLTPDQIASIHRAMEVTGGVLSQAAKILDMPLSSLHMTLTKVESLRVRWRPEAPPQKQPAKSIHVEPTEIEVAQELKLALESEERAVKERRLEEMGFSKRNRDMVMRLEKIHKQGIGGLTDMVRAGVAKATVELITVQDEINRMILEDSLPESFKGIGGDGKPIYEVDKRAWIETLKNITSEIRQLDKQVHADDLTALLIEQKRREIEREGRSQPKQTAGFVQDV